MGVRRMSVGLLVMVMVLAAVSITIPAMAQQAGGDKTMWCNLPNEQFHKLCQDKEFMKGLTMQQKMEIDKEWQRRIPNMTPAEVQKYYPAGTRYGSSMGQGG